MSEGTRSGLRGSPGSKKRLPGLTVAEGLLKHPFDLENGMRTSGLVAGRHLKSGHRHDRHATAYFGVAPSVFHSLFRRWRQIRMDEQISDTTFIDLGAGMGRAVLLAAELRFRAVRGVELHPTLARIARDNLRRWRLAGRVQSPVQIQCRDASEVEYPRGPCLVFLFNPFGAAVLRSVLKRAAVAFENRSSELDLIYVNNEQEAEFEKVRGFVRLFLGKVRRSHADAKADQAILANQPEGEYAFAEYEDCSIWRWMGDVASSE
ncbi:MAG TPA: hypothetical protein VK716_00645 [Terracidiphilus sp.]|jgi:predicted RNA methylase|nr:hypothetical protein [Terracidiphilus sp.]